ncbi:MAG: ankyrin repeat domain-containing protein [Campylobacteraceae bacterium]|nr:ankyrin repeat domain-containing protein [Campylobacteraceae bacterium]
MDFIVKSLDIAQKESQYQKIYQRFVKEKNISSQEYYDTLNTIVEDILYVFYEDIKNKYFIYYEKLIKEFLNFYNQIKLRNESLTSSQKQLDFIILANLFIPFLGIAIPVGIAARVHRIIPIKNHKSTQKLFDFIQEKCPSINIKEKLSELLKEKSDKGYDTVNKDVNNWIEGKNLPNKKYIQLISESLASIQDVFKENELKIYFNLAKIIQYLIDKSIGYFGEDLTELLVLHWIMTVSINTNICYGNIQDYDGLEAFFIKKCRNPNLVRCYIEYYLDIQQLFIMINYKIDSRDIDIAQYEEDMRSLFDNMMERVDALVKIGKNIFFDTIDMFLPVKHLTAEQKIIPIKSIEEISKNEELSNIQSAFIPIRILTEISKEKTKELENELILKFEEIEKQYETADDPYFNFCKARYYAQKREYKKSTTHYLKAFECGKNCVGDLIKAIIKEGLFVSAQTTKNIKVDLINAKSPFVKFYNEAYFYKLLDYLPEEINQSFLNDMKKNFDWYFKCLYPDTKPADPNKMMRNIGLIHFDDNIKADFKKPNKLIKDVSVNPVSQLIYFVLFGDFDTIKSLVECGADVNYTRETDNYTALITALENKIDENKMKIAKFLIPKMSKKTINARLFKKQESALSLAINKGLVEIVEMLIEYGADLSQKITLDKVTPIYLCLLAINFTRTKVLKLPSLTKGRFITKNPLDDENELRKILKAQLNRYHIFYDEKREELSRLFSIFSEKNIEAIHEYNIRNTYGNSLENLYKIFDILLEATQDTNALHRENFTVLIFATSLNEEELVRKIVKKGGDKNLRTSQGATAYDYARENGNFALMNLLK